MELEGNGDKLNEYRVVVWSDKNVLILTVAMAAQLSEYIKKLLIVQFKCVNCVICGLYLTEDIILKI